MLRLKEGRRASPRIKEDGIYFDGQAFSQLLKVTLEKKAALRFKAKGFSMSPFIKDGDVITISPLPRPLVMFGRPVAFISPRTGTFIVHRVIGRKGESYRIKADALSQADVLVPRENILGYVTKVERDGRRIFPGLGPERCIIAFLSKYGLLSFVFRGWRLLPFSFRRFLSYAR